jgi:uncharacterized protein with HEPN domain
MVSPDYQRILHIHNYCDRIEKTVQRYGRNYDTFLSDGDYIDSVSMKIMQIGELVGGLSEEFRESTKSRMQWGAIRGMRNLFAHAYASMDKEVIWDVATQDIPGLLQFCADILAQEGIVPHPSPSVNEIAAGDKPSVMAAIEKDREERRNNPPSSQKKAHGNDDPEL